MSFVAICDHTKALRVREPRRRTVKKNQTPVVVEKPMLSKEEIVRAKREQRAQKRALSLVQLYDYGHSSDVKKGSRSLFNQIDDELADCYDNDRLYDRLLAQFRYEMEVQESKARADEFGDLDSVSL